MGVAGGGKGGEASGSVGMVPASHGCKDRCRGQARIRVRRQARPLLPMNLAPSDRSRLRRLASEMSLS